MFDLRRLVHWKRPEPQPAGEPVKLVAITQNPEDALALSRIASGYGWKISIVGSSNEAVASLNAPVTPLVICDRDLSGESWREVLKKLAAQTEPVCVLVASRVLDDYLWNDVIRHHGYDVVVKPFEPATVHRVVSFAWSWRGWAHRHQVEISRKPDKHTL